MRKVKDLRKWIAYYDEAERLVEEVALALEYYKEEITTRIPQLDEEKTALEAKLSTGTLSHEDLMKASERIGELIEEMDLLTLRQLELEEKEA